MCVGGGGAGGWGVELLGAVFWPEGIVLGPKAHSSLVCEIIQSELTNGPSMCNMRDFLTCFFFSAAMD